MPSEPKLKHLEFIQNVITRMANNSFLIKGWSVTLVAALLALESKTANIGCAVIAVIPVSLFWILDGFFLSREKRYRELFRSVAAKKEDEIDFSMDASPFAGDDNSWSNCALSPTLLTFHGVLFGVTLVTFAVIFGLSVCSSH